MNKTPNQSPLNDDKESIILNTGKIRGKNQAIILSFLYELYYLSNLK